ncbi:MAG: hypothetical protein ACTSYA_05930 [Candidatus Kariarchaeaceae archaeon]
MNLFKFKNKSDKLLNLSLWALLYLALLLPNGIFQSKAEEIFSGNVKAIYEINQFDINSKHQELFGLGVTGDLTGSVFEIFIGTPETVLREVFIPETGEYRLKQVSEYSFSALLGVKNEITVNYTQQPDSFFPLDFANFTQTCFCANMPSNSLIPFMFPFDTITEFDIQSAVKGNIIKFIPLVVNTNWDEHLTILSAISLATENLDISTSLSTEDVFGVSISYQTESNMNYFLQVLWSKENGVIKSIKGQIGEAEREQSRFSLKLNSIESNNLSFPNFPIYEFVEGNYTHEGDSLSSLVPIEKYTLWNDRLLTLEFLDTTSVYDYELRLRIRQKSNMLVLENIVIQENAALPTSPWWILNFEEQERMISGLDAALKGLAENLEGASVLLSESDQFRLTINHLNLSTNYSANETYSYVFWDAEIDITTTEKYIKYVPVTKEFNLTKNYQIITSGWISFNSTGILQKGKIEISQEIHEKHEAVDFETLSYNSTENGSLGLVINGTSLGEPLQPVTSNEKEASTLAFLTIILPTLIIFVYLRIFRRKLRM